MEQKDQKRPKRDKPSPQWQERISIINNSKSQEVRSKFRSAKDSEIKEFKKPKIKLNTLSTIGSLGIEDQIKKEIASTNKLLQQCDKDSKVKVSIKSEKEQLIQLEEVIKEKNKTIQNLTIEIGKLKTSDKNIPEEDNQSSAHKNTDASEKEKLFKLADEMRAEREELAKFKIDYVERYSNYVKIKKLIQEIQHKYTRNQYKNEKSIKEEPYTGPMMMTYQDFKEKAMSKKQQQTNKGKKIDFYHHLSPQKQANPSKNMKDLIVRKNITRDAIKNSKRKHTVQMNELFAKIQFLKDEDILLTQKIRQKQLQLSNMEKKFSERKGDINKLGRNYHT